jgi:hypothetical protein
MTSEALERWRSERSERLDKLFEAHVRIGGTGPGRRARQDELINRQINAALVLQLAAEFQGFARELHDQLREAVFREAADLPPGFIDIVGRALTEPRKLDRGNATAATLGSDFARFGIDLWPRLRDRDARNQGRQTELERLNRARNALAHSDERELRKLQDEGVRIKLEAVRGWRRALDQLASAMDASLSDRFAAHFAGRRPW